MKFKPMIKQDAFQQRVFKKLINFLYRERGIPLDRLIFNTQENIDLNELNISINQNKCYICECLPLIKKTCRNCNINFCSNCISNKNFSKNKFVSNNYKNENIICKNCNMKFVPYTEEIKILDYKEFDFCKNIKIKCMFYENGCEEVLSLDLKEILNHEERCSYYISCQGCFKSFSLIELDNFEIHQTKCDLIKVKCKECGFEETQRNMIQNIPFIKHLTHIIKKELKIEMENSIKKYLNSVNMSYNKFEEYLNYHKELENSLNLEFQKTLTKNSDNSFDLPDRFCVLTLIKNIPNFNEKYGIKNMGESFDKNENILNNTNMLKTYNNESNKKNNNGMNNQNSKKLLSIDFRIEFENFLSYYADFLVYGTNDYDLEIYDLKNNKIYKTIKKAHSSNIICVRNNIIVSKLKNYVLSTSFDRSIKIWDAEDMFTNILNLNEVFTDYSLFSALILEGEYLKKNTNKFNLDDSGFNRDNSDFLKDNSQSFLNLDMSLNISKENALVKNNKVEREKQIDTNSTFDGKLFLFAACHNLNSIKIYQINNNVNSNNTILFQNIHCKKPRFMDFFLYINKEYENSELFIIVSGLSEIYSYTFDGKIFNFFRAFSEKAFLVKENVRNNQSLNIENNSFFPEEQINNKNHNSKNTPIKDEDRDSNFDVGHSYFKIFRNKSTARPNSTDELYLLIESDFSGTMRTWDFFSGDLLKKIDLNFIGLKSISSFAFINEKFFLISGSSEKMFLLDFNEEDVGKALKKILFNKGAINNQIYSMKLINDINNGLCILSYGYNCEINLWNRKMINN